MNICTIIAKNYASQARVLAESFRAKHPDGGCTVLVIDEFEGYLEPDDEPFELIGIDQIGLPDPEKMAASYDVTELSTAVKPWLLRHLLDRDGVEAITYLDPDIWIADSIEEIDRLAREHGVVLTPHFTAPLPRDGRRPSEEDILIAGAYNLGFIALGGGEVADELLAWWSERLEYDCLIEPDKGRFVDQRWIDLVPGIWPRTHILRDTAYNVAYWNLPMRPLEPDPAGGYLVDRKPLRFFHFSGFDPATPTALSKHQNRIEVPRSRPLARICAEYAALLLEQGHRETKSWEYGWGRLPNGVRLDAAARRLYREAAEEGRTNGSVFSRRGADRFVAYLNESAGGNGRVSRYASAIHEQRADLRIAFPNVEGADAPAYKQWMRESADDLRISDLLLPESEPGRQKKGGGGRSGRLGVNLAGYLSSELGVGEAARQVLSALREAGVGIAPIDVPVDAAELPRELGDLDDSDLPFDFSLICVNADMLPTLAAASSPALFADRHSAGLWFWEVEEFPQRWQGSFEHVDEVWAASEFVADALRASSPVPVRTVRIPVTPVEPAAAGRVELGMPEGFCFLYLFDYRSVFRRKNPLATIEAFRRAFEPGAGAGLVIKTIGSESSPREKAILADAAAGHPDIHLIDGVVDAPRKNAMLAACDCYVSLHRSEGLGLTIAEAMYFGKPAIATAYSGNLDFMTAENSYPVGYELCDIGADAGPYPPGAHWAEPDAVEAAEMMRAAFEDPEGAAKRGRRAAAEIRSTHSSQAAGRLLEEHLTAVRRERVLARLDAPRSKPGANGRPAGEGAGAELEPAAGRSPADPASGRAQLHHLLRFEAPPPRPESGPLRRWLKRAYLRLLRPYTAYQHRIDLSTRRSIDELSGELAALERRVERSAKEAFDKTREDLLALEQRARDEGGELGNELRESVSELDSELRESVSDLTSEVASRASAIESIEQAIDSMREALSVTRSVAESGLETSEVLAERDTELRATLASHQEQILQALRLAGSAGTRMTEHQRGAGERQAAQREQIDDLAGEVARLAKAVEASAGGAEAEIAQGGDPIGQLRDEHDRALAETLGAINVLRDQVTAIEEDAGSKPYMTEDRFSTRSDPQLGKVIGFRSGSRGGYLAFEDLFRGPEEMIRERQRVYVDLVGDVGPVLDLGCGRGEFLELLRDAGVDARGVDLDPGMVERCRQKGLENVAQGDLLDVLRGTPKRSLGCVFSAQVVEHLGPRKLERLLRLSCSRLRPGGVLIAETVNPHSARALKAFWVDPTHKQPLFPETMLALCELAGFAAGDAFCPMGDGDWETDRLTQGEYAIVAKSRTTP